MKKIEDYLFLYLGCEATVWDEDEGDGFGVLTGIHGEYQAEIQLIENGNASEHPEYYEYKNVKPILRPLSDMTEEEQKQFCANEFNVDIKEIYELVNVEGNIQFRVQQKYGIHLCAFKSISPISFIFFLKQGFDLFNLIPDGLALDKNKLK